METRTRKTTRIPGYHYSDPGAYFLTMCTLDRARLLSRIRVTGDTAVTDLLEYGRVVECEILKMNGIYNHLRVDKYVIMPDHVHLLLTVMDPVLRNAPPEAKNSAVAKYVGTLKRFCNRKYGRNIWQKGSNDHVIRNQEDYNTRWEYMEKNPMNWIITGKNGPTSP